MPSVTISELGYAIRAARTESKLTQAELARRAVVSRSTVIKLEVGKAPDINDKVLTSILGVLGLRLVVTEVSKCGLPVLGDE